MIGSLIIFIELGFFSLLLLLVFRMLILTRSEPLVPAMTTSEPNGSHRKNTNQAGVCYREPQQDPPVSKPLSASRYPDKSELISQLHILASLQDRDCKQQGLEIESAHPGVREYAVCWLYGAACALSLPGSRNSEVLAVIVSQFASRKVGIRQPEALAVISTLTRHSAFLSCFRSGIEGAEFWKIHHFVTMEKSLFEAVTSNAFV